jgi:signal transduction histidine kinase
MKLDIPLPLDRFGWFQERLDLRGETLDKLDRYRNLLAGKKVQFSESFCDYFKGIPETRGILEHEGRKKHLKQAWTHWFESLFRENFNPRFLGYLWRSGLRHVEVNIDQRYINLGYAVVRQFCQSVAREEIPEEDREDILVAIDKMIDYCVLIETHAYITATSRCDIEVVKGISHQVRNPLTVIGGHVARLKRAAEPQSGLQRVYDTILAENKRLEDMVREVSVYSEMFQKEPRHEEIRLESLISSALERLKETLEIENVAVDIKLDPRFPRVRGDARDLETMFYYLLQNSFQAVHPLEPYIRIRSRRPNLKSHFLEVEIFNSGTPPTLEDLDNLFVPFFSSKPQGTGFGLPIAQLAARKSLGELRLRPVEGSGTQCIVTLPTAA